MKWEQKRRDKDIVLYIKLAVEAANQLNLLMPRLQEAP